MAMPDLEAALDVLRLRESDLTHHTRMTSRAREEAGAALRRERVAAGIALRAMARQLGVSAPYLSDIELGRRWSADVVYRAARALGVRVNAQREVRDG